MAISIQLTNEGEERGQQHTVKVGSSGADAVEDDASLDTAELASLRTD